MVLRYINHSCAPNCVAEVVTFERGHKIIISCVCRIAKGEEVGIFSLHWRCNIFGRVPPRTVSSLLTLFQLCFDYQLECVEGQHKTACHCGAPECRKWINWGKEWQQKKIKTDKSKHIPCRDVCSHPSLHRGKKAAHSFYEQAEGPNPERWTDLRGARSSGRSQATWLGCDLCHMWEGLLPDASVSMYVSVCLVYMRCGNHQRMGKHCAGCGLIAY